MVNNSGHHRNIDFERLIARLDQASIYALQSGIGEAIRLNISLFDLEFLLMGISRTESSGILEFLDVIQLRPNEFRGLLRAQIPFDARGWKAKTEVRTLGAEALGNLLESKRQAVGNRTRSNNLSISPQIISTLDYATALVSDTQVTPDHLLLAILQHAEGAAVDSLNQLLINSNMNPEKFVDRLVYLAGVRSDALAELNIPISPSLKNPPIPLNEGGLLVKLGRDLTALALADQIDPAIGDHAHKAMLQIARVLQQAQSNNPILLGDPGVGKTAIVEGFAYRLAREVGIFPELARIRVVDLSTTALLSGIGDRGELESRIQKLLKEVRDAKGQIVLFVDELHTLLRSEGIGEVLANALKPALARGEFPLIGATTISEYRRFIESDAALTRRFSPVWIDEPSVGDTIKIITGVVNRRLSRHHQVEYPEEVITESIHLSMRYIHDEFLPGKAIKILDQAGPRVKMGQSLRVPGIGKSQSLTGTVTVDVIRSVVADRTGVPLTQLSQSEKERLQKLEKHLQERVRGQSEAIQALARVVKRAQVGLSDPKRPLGVFLFAGPSGVGKTELAIALAEALFDSEDALFRLDMSEFMEKFQVSRLTGSPPGYVGYEEEQGQLTERLRRYPYSVIVLDEIEKAHIDVQNLFLQLFDAGRISDARGNLADGRNAIFIMTTNLGAKEALDDDNRATYEAHMHSAIERHFRPEFISRVNKIVYFNPLDRELLSAIFDKFFEQVNNRFQSQGIELEVTNAFKMQLCNKYADKKRGARALLHGIDEEIVTPLTDKLLSGEITAGMKIILDTE